MKCANCGSEIPGTFANLRHYRVEWEGNKPWRGTSTHPAMMKAELCSLECVAQWAQKHGAVMG